MRVEDVDLWPDEFMKSLTKKLGFVFHIHNTNFRLCMKFVWQDMWIGAFYSKKPCSKLYICIIPMLPIIIQWWERRK